jgi:hypothetical protein
MSFKIESMTEQGAHDTPDALVENLSVNNAKLYINNTDFLSIGSIKLSPVKVWIFILCPSVLIIDVKC